MTTLGIVYGKKKSLFLKYDAINTYGAEKVRLHVILIAAVDAYEWSSL
jgi:hypothetical protein